MGQDVYYSGEIAICPALTESDAAVLRAATNLQRTEETRPFVAAVAASPEPDVPYHGGLIEISEDREFILPEQDESRHGFRMWLRLLIEHYLAPRGYVLNGGHLGRRRPRRQRHHLRQAKSGRGCRRPHLQCRSKLGSKPLCR